MAGHERGSAPAPAPAPVEPANNRVSPRQPCKSACHSRLVNSGFIARYPRPRVEKRARGEYSSRVAAAPQRARRRARTRADESGRERRTEVRRAISMRPNEREQRGDYRRRCYASARRGANSASILLLLRINFTLAVYELGRGKSPCTRKGKQSAVPPPSFPRVAPSASRPRKQRFIRCKLHASGPSFRNRDARFVLASFSLRSRFVLVSPPRVSAACDPLNSRIMRIRDNGVRATACYTCNRLSSR